MSLNFHLYPHPEKYIEKNSFFDENNNNDDDFEFNQDFDTLDNSLMLVTALNSKIGYYKAAEIFEKPENVELLIQEIENFEEKIITY